MRDAEMDQAPIGLSPDIYARWRDSDVGAIADRLERRLMLDLLGDVRGRRILDVGCGDGELAVELAKRGAQVVGIDPSPDMLAAARWRADREGVDLEVVLATAQHLPFPTGQFDLAVAMTVLCFVEDATPALEEIARVLRPGGRMVIGELGKWNSWAAGRRLRSWFWPTLWRRVRFRSAAELRRLAGRAGLESGAVRGAVYFPRWGPAARVMAPFDPRLGRTTTLGAAFLALSAVKPLETTAPPGP